MAGSSSKAPDLQFRRELKISLTETRHIGLLPTACPVCGKAVGQGPEMHEVFITRGDVQATASNVKEAIHTRENCVLLHSACHVQAATEEGKTACVKHILFFEGYANVIAWLQYMNELLRGSQVENEIRYLNRLAKACANGALGLTLQ